MYQLGQLSFAVAVLMSATTLATPIEQIFGRAVGDQCKGTHGPGDCRATAACKGISYREPFCPNDPDDIQCCVEIPCNVNGASGYCRSVANNGCPGGVFQAGAGPAWPCPGTNDIQCCIKSAPGPSPPPPPGPILPPPPPPPGRDIGAEVLAQAKKAAGTPYAWGGGSCAGPTGDQPPYDNGEVGYDCSGLLGWAVCKVTGRDLFSEGLRVTSTMYCASESKLKYKKYPYAQRRVGDAVFFGGSCRCGTKDIHHVGIIMEDINKMWNAPNDDVNVVGEISIKGYGEKPCPDVIRIA